MSESNRLVAIIFEVADLERSAALYLDGFGIDLHAGGDNESGMTAGSAGLTLRRQDPYLHFALYEAKTPQPSTMTQLAFMRTTWTPPTRT